MVKFKWQGYTSDGQKTNGEIASYSAALARYELSQKNLTIISLKKIPNTLLANFRRQKLDNKLLLLFFQKLSMLSASGIALVQSLELIIPMQSLTLLQKIIVTLKNEVATGKCFSSALRQYPQYFNEFICNLIFLGEETGNFAQILNQIVLQMEEKQQFQNQLKRALFYPLFVLSISLLITLLMLLWIVPAFGELFANTPQTLPKITLAILAVSLFLREFGWIILSLFFLALVFLIYFLKTPLGKQKLADFFLKLPLIGNVMQKFILLRFSHYLAIALQAGLPMVEALTLITHTLGNLNYVKALGEIKNQVNAGNALHVTLLPALFPSPAPELIRIGEESGQLVPILFKLTSYYQEEIRQFLHHFSQLLEPLLITILGVLIGGLVVALYLPLFKLGTAI